VQQTKHVLAQRYELGPVLGEGGMARVHRGYDRHLRRPVAIKVLAPAYDRDKGSVERFRREARAAAGLSHPNVVSVFDSGSYHGTNFIVTELVEGETLAERLRRGPMAPEQAVSVAVDVTRALEAAHARGLIHRDIKPGNVMLLPDGRVKVVDFGIARAAGSDTLTGTGVVLGSTAYLSPEQASGQPVDERADLYALGCVLYEMVTGAVPFDADTPVATMYRHVNEDVPPPSSIRPVPAGLELVIMRCLEKDPRRRFATAADLEHALLSARGDTRPLEAVPDDQTEPIAVAGAPIPAAGEADAAATAPMTERRVDRARSPTLAHRRGSGRPPWLLPALAVVALLVLAAVLIAANADPLPSPAQARRVAARAEGAQPTPSPSTSPVTFGAAWSNLVAVIDTARSTGELEEHAAEELSKHAAEMADAYQDGDAEKLDEAISKLEEELGRAVEAGEVSSSAADAIDQAVSEVVVALHNEGLLATVSPPSTEEGEGGSSGPRSEDSSGPGSGSDGNGPPPHAEANGHDED
jgi:eukaryotic-like serine/threonine-protein kinase